MRNTELIEAILKSQKAREILDWLPPVYGDAYVFLWLLEVIGTEIGEMEQWTEEVRKQVVSQTATWSLPYWEERYNVPTDPDATLDMRRANVILRMWQRAPVNPYKLEEILQSMTGLPVTIEENTGKNRFTVLFEGYAGLESFARSVKEINRLKPAHLIYTLRYLHGFEVSQVVSCHMCMAFTAPVIVRGKPRTLDGSWPLDGSCLLDATWRLGSYGVGHGCRMKVRQEAAFDAGIALGKGVRALPRTTHQTGLVFTAPMVVRGTMRRLDGSWPLDGSCLLDNVWRLGVYGIGNGCHMGARQEVAFGASEWNGSHVQASASAHGGMGMAAEAPARCHVGSPKMEASMGVSCQLAHGAMIEARKDLWRLDGTVKPDGSRRLDVEIHGLEL